MADCQKKDIDMKCNYLFGGLVVFGSAVCIAFFDDTRSRIGDWFTQKKQTITQSHKYKNFKEGIKTQYGKVRYRLKTSKSNRVIDIQKELQKLRVEQAQLERYLPQTKKNSEEYLDILLRLFAIQNKIKRLEEQLLKLQA